MAHMIDEQLLLSNNIHDVCYEVVKLETKSSVANANQQRKLIKSVVVFYRKHVMGSKNVYSSVFLMKKLSLLESAKTLPLYRKLLVEIYVYLATCNKPYTESTASENKAERKSKPTKESLEAVLKHELETYRREEVLVDCVNRLYKTKADVLWKVLKMVVRSLRMKHLVEYVDVLEFMNMKDENKLFLLEGYKCICSEHVGGYFYSDAEYMSIIFQCMMKINYVYEEMGLFDKHMYLYEACLNCPLNLLVEGDTAKKNVCMFAADGVLVTKMIDLEHKNERPPITHLKTTQIKHGCSRLEG